MAQAVFSVGRLRKTGEVRTVHRANFSSRCVAIGIQLQYRGRRGEADDGEVHTMDCQGRRGLFLREWAVTLFLPLFGPSSPILGAGRYVISPVVQWLRL